MNEIWWYFTVLDVNNCLEIMKLPICYLYIIVRDAHMWSETSKLICLRHLFWTTAVANLKFIYKNHLYIFPRAQRILSYHLYKYHGPTRYLTNHCKYQNLGVVFIDIYHFIRSLRPLIYFSLIFDKELDRCANINKLPSMIEKLSMS